MDNDLQENILKHIGGTAQNNLNHILQNFVDSSDEIRTFYESPYIEITDLEKHLFPVKDQFSILSINIQSLNAKFDSLVLMLSLLKERGLAFTAICLQETWLEEKQATHFFNISGYNIISRGKTCGSKGGLLIYLRDDLSYNIHDIKLVSTQWEFLGIDIYNETMKRSMTLCNIYRPPRDNCSNSSIDVFLKDIIPLLDNIITKNNDIAVAGDFNIDLLKINERNKFQEYFDTFVSRGLFPKLTLPTRFSKNNGSLIDQIFCKFSHATQNSSSGIILSYMSDHLPCFTTLDIFSTSHKCPKYVTINRNDKFSQDKFSDCLQNKLRDSDISRDLCRDPNENHNVVETNITEAIDLHLQPKTVRFDKYRHKMSPWITRGILHSIKFRDKLYKEFKLTDPNSPSYESAEINLKTYRSILQKTIRAAKTSYYSNMFNKFINDSRKTWRTINEVLNKCKDKRSFPNYFIINNSKVNDKQQIADKFNDFFVNIGPNLSRNITNTSGKTVKSFLKQIINSQFSFDLVDDSHISKVLSQITSKTSSGHDGISTKLLKRIAPFIIPYLTIIINQSLVTGIFPTRMKIAKVIPLFKKDDPHVLDNYRPISLLPALSKVLEKVVFIQIYDYFDKNGLFYKNQYGFRKIHSTELASLEITDIISENMDHGKLPLSIFLDLSKAFDTLDHTILLDKLKYYGLNNVALNWFNSYLSGRTQYVDFDNVSSQTRTIDTGVPQGSILGPLLFIIYMNDIHIASDKFHAILYADDTNLVSSLCSFNVNISTQLSSEALRLLSANINSELQLITDWLEINKLSLNIKKTKFMIFHYPQKNISRLIPNLSINGYPIDRVHEFNFLGLTIDEHLNWNGHIQKVSNKISRALGILSRVKRYLPKRILITLYNSLILPHLQYSILAWGSKNNRLVKLQKRALRIISNSKYNAHTDPLFKAFHLLKLEDIFELNALKLYHNFLNNKLPHFFQNMFTMEQTHQYETRSASFPNPCHIKTSGAKKRVKYFLPNMLQNISPHILDKIQTHSIKGFARYYKNEKIKAYQSECHIVNCYICGQSDNTSN